MQNSTIIRTRAQYAVKYPTPNHLHRMDHTSTVEILNKINPSKPVTIEDYANSPTYIYNPTIDRIERGMMVRYWLSRRSNSVRKAGTLVEAVNFDTNQVLIRDHIGGTKEHQIQVDVQDICVVWAIGSYEFATNLINQFNGALSNLISK